MFEFLLTTKPWYNLKSQFVRFQSFIVYFSYKHIVEDKSTKAFTVDKKKKVWEKIKNDYNCSGETGSRNSKQLKGAYGSWTTLPVFSKYSEGYGIKRIYGLDHAT
jgi:hypothetical protein